MAEPRARQRGKGQVFHTGDLAELLYGFGDNPTPHGHAGGSLPSTILTLDEILTDFIIETCHAAALSASYSRRQKIKVDDFKFVLRKDDRLLGRVLENLWRDKVMKESRKTINFDEIGKENLAELEGIAALGGVGGKDTGKGKGRRRKRKTMEDVDAEEPDRKRAVT